MRKNKNENGITLIALIITIILLLILAIVTISAVNEGNLFVHANTAATKYKEEAELENIKVASYLSEMQKYDVRGTSDRLIYNKAYAGTIEETPLKIWFLKGTNKIIANYNNIEGIDRVLNYNWNPNTDELNVMEGDCTLSADGKTITYGTYDITVTSEAYDYNTTKMSSADVDLYNGMYYCKTANKMILIQEYATGFSIVIENENTYVDSIPNLASTLSRIGITVENNKKITYHENEYEWMASI